MNDLLLRLGIESSMPVLDGLLLPPVPLLALLGARMTAWWRGLGPRRVQGHCPLAFEREMGRREADLRAWLPGASGQRSIAWCECGALIGLDDARASIPPAGALHARLRPVHPKGRRLSEAHAWLRHNGARHERPASP